MTVGNAGTLAALVALSFFGMIGKAVSGFGENILVQIGWHLLALCGLVSGDLAESDLILTVIMVPLMTCQAWLQSQHCNRKLAFIYCFTTSVSSVVGVVMVYKLDGDWLRRVLGLVMIGVFVQAAVAEVQSHITCCKRGLRDTATNGDHTVAPPASSPSPDNAGEKLSLVEEESQYDPCASTARVIMVCCFGLVSGLLGGLFACPGPPNMVFVLFSKIKKDEWRGTSASFNVVQLLVRLATQLLVPQGRTLISRPSVWLECGVSYAAGVAGMLLGNRLNKYVNERLFRQLLLFFLLAGGLSLATAGMGDASTWVTVVLFLLLTLVALTHALLQLSCPSSVESKLPVRKFRHAPLPEEMPDPAPDQNGTPEATPDPTQLGRRSDAEVV